MSNPTHKDLDTRMALMEQRIVTLEAAQKADNAATMATLKALDTKLDVMSKQLSIGIGAANILKWLIGLGVGCAALYKFFTG